MKFLQIFADKDTQDENLKSDQPLTRAQSRKSTINVQTSCQPSTLSRAAIEDVPILLDWERSIEVVLEKKDTPMGKLTL